MAYTQTSNDMKTRNVPGIALGEANEKGGHYFMSLYTGKRVHAFAWKELPIHQDVINKVEQFAEEEGQPTMIDKEPIFEWAPGVTITNDEENEHTEETHNHDNEEQDLDDQQPYEADDNSLVTDDEDASQVDDYKNKQEDNSSDNDESDEINHEYDEENFDQPVNENFNVIDLDQSDTEFEEINPVESQERDNLIDDAP